MSSLHLLSNDGPFPWLENPVLITAANPRKGRRKVKMAQRSKRTGRFVRTARKTRKPRKAASHRINPHRRRRRSPSRRRKASSGFLAMFSKPKARRRRSTNPRRRGYRRNPGTGGTMRVFGFGLPAVDAMAFTAAGFLAPALVSEYLMRVIPESWKVGTAGTLVNWSVKIISAFAPGYLVRKFVSPKAGNYMMIGGGAQLVLEIMRTFLPGVIPGLGHQPLLGTYPRAGLNDYFNNPRTLVPFSRSRAALPAMLASTPDRLNPAGRF